MNRSQLNSPRNGYALLMCLMVVAVTSSILLTLFSGLRLQTTESNARRQIIINTALADGAFEHGLAILLDNPSYAGQVAFQVPNSPNYRYTLNIQQAANTIQMNVDLQAGAARNFFARTYSSVELQQRRLTLGLN